MMIIIENGIFSLTIDDNCIARSLVLKSSGEECLNLDQPLALFSLTEERPYNNEIKLAHLNKRTVFEANRVRREGNQLIVGFETVKFEAVVEIKETDSYVAFTLVDFIVPPEAFGNLIMVKPPVLEFRLLQLPIANREKFGDWLNVSWDDDVAINVLATSVYTKIDSCNRGNYRIMHADAIRDIRLKGCGAALIVASPSELLDCIDRLEKDFCLPGGVASRRSDKLNVSAYRTSDITPKNADSHIAYAKKGGFGMMLITYTSFCKEEGWYALTGDYDFNENYPGGIEDLKALLKKLKAEGITPGLHILHSHIGIKSRYVTPVADHRLNLVRQFSLAKPLSENDTVIYVEQNPEGSPDDPRIRVLKFGGEIISYESYTTEYPYCFTGCTRGHFDTRIISHQIGEIGGLLDISEFGADSVHIDERTSLQDEVAEKLAAIYNAGFEYIYFDGSEATNPPFEFNVPYAQYRVYKRLANEPLFCEGAAKSHFSWHMISGGNAFDPFPTDIFKEKLAEFPLTEVPDMASNFTRLNFGWWAFYEDTRPDIYEYGTSKAAACDCPATLLSNPSCFEKNARTDDILEVLRRWEDVRRKNWLTQSQKNELKDPDKEFILLTDKQGDYNLVEYHQIKNVAGGNPDVSAFYFELSGKNYVVCWHNKGAAKLALPLTSADIRYEDDPGGVQLETKKTKDSVVISVAGRRYFSADVSKETIISAFENATVTN